MKKLFLLLLTFAFTGCSTLNDTINTLPGYEFEQFDYSRTGNITSTTLSASTAKIENNMLIVEKAHVTHSNPIFGVNISVQGLKRPAVVSGTGGVK
ncbi:MAG: hypothetical protein VW879_06660 [Opitutae bacterium]